LTARHLALVAGGVAAAAHVAPAAASWRHARNRLLPGLAGVGRSGHVALTFDDGPDPVATPAFLDILDELGWRGTFFLLGTQVQRDPALARAIVERGHEVGVHGMVHTSHLRRPWTWTTADVRAAVAVVADATGVVPTWFRPPYGALSASSLVAAGRTGTRTVLWTTWGRDWRPDATPASVAATVARTEYPGPTVLLHDSDISSAPGSWRAALGALPLLADRWRTAGWSVGTLGDHEIAAVPAADPARVSWNTPAKPGRSRCAALAPAGTDRGFPRPSP
jgi:peptidoglycan-N-acetylglucosamine deacetylase